MLEAVARLARAYQQFNTPVLISLQGRVNIISRAEKSHILTLGLNVIDAVILAGGEASRQTDEGIEIGRIKLRVMYEEISGELCVVKHGHVVRQLVKRLDDSAADATDEQPGALLLRSEIEHVGILLVAAEERHVLVTFVGMLIDHG